MPTQRNLLSPNPTHCAVSHIERRNQFAIGAYFIFKIIPRAAKTASRLCDVLHDCVAYYTRLVLELLLA